MPKACLRGFGEGLWSFVSAQFGRGASVIDLSWRHKQELDIIQGVRDKPPQHSASVSSPK